LELDNIIEQIRKYNHFKYLNERHYLIYSLYSLGIWCRKSAVQLLPYCQILVLGS